MSDSIRKKKKKGPSKSALLCIMISILAICIAILCHINKSDNVIPSQSLNKNITDSESLILFSCPESNLYTVEIRPYLDESYTLYYHDGEMLLENDPEYPVSQGILKDTIVYASYVCAMEKAYDPALNTDNTLIPSPSDFGLQPPACTVVITDTEHNTITLYMGKSVPADQFTRYYMTTDRDDIVYLISDDMFNAFTFKKHMLHTVDLPGIKADLIDCVMLTGQTDLSLRLNRGYWYIDSPYHYPANTAAVDRLLTKLENLRFSSWVGLEAETDLAAYGLTNPRLKVTVMTADSIIEGYDSENQFHSIEKAGDSHTLLIGNDFNAVSFYCLFDDTVYIGTYFTMGFLLDLCVDDFILLNPVNFSITELEKLTVETEEINTTYTITLEERVLQNGELETDPDSGELIYDIIVSKNNTLIDSDTFLIWYYKLTQLCWTGKLRTDMSLPPVPFCTVTLVCDDIQRVIRLYSVSPVEYAINIDGTSLCYINSDVIDALPSLP